VLSDCTSFGLRMSRSFSVENWSHYVVNREQKVKGKVVDYAALYTVVVARLGMYRSEERIAQKR
jgi:hypothetical protein